MIGDDYVSVAQRQRQEYEKPQQRRRMKRQIWAFFQRIPDKIRRALVAGNRGRTLRSGDGSFFQSRRSRRTEMAVSRKGG